MPKAKITLTVTGFIDINGVSTGPRWSTVTLPPTITDSAGGKVSLNGNAIVVQGPANIQLEFTIASGIAGKTFSPAGAFFTQTSGTTDHHGANNFSVDSMTATTITLVDKYNDHAPAGSAPAWEFFLVIQDEGNAYGIIDPDIENQN